MNTAQTSEDLDVESRRQTPPAGIDLYYGAVVKANHSSNHSAADVISEEEHYAANQYKFERDRRRYRATRRMVRNLLSKYASIEPHAWIFEKNEYGKPAIHSEQQCGLYFNVSHTSSMIVCAVSAFPQIGVDVEDQVPDNYHDVATRFFAREERDWLRDAQSTQEEGERFLSIWTLKEAYIKAIGQGLSIPLTSFSVCPNDGRQFVVDGCERERWSFRRYDVAESRIAVVFPNRFDSIDCHLMEVEPA